MLIQKTFHLHLVREAAQAQLQDLARYRHELAGIETAARTPDGGAHFVFRLPGRFRADVELVALPGDLPSQTLFRSTRGNIEVLGVLEYFQIRPTLTEIVLTVDYRIGPAAARWIDRLAHGLDRLLNRELACLERALAQPPKNAGSRSR